MSVLAETIDTNTEFVVRLSLRPWPPPSESFRAGMPPHQLQEIREKTIYGSFECRGLGYIEPTPFNLARIPLGKQASGLASGSVKASGFQVDASQAPRV